MLENRVLGKRAIEKDNSNKKAFMQLAIMIGLTVMTQVVTILKTSTVAGKFGATVEMDAFNFSNSIGTFIFSFIGAGITTVLIPNLVKKDKQEGVNIFISTLYTIAFGVLLVVYFNRKFIIQGLSGGNEEFISIACNIMLITLITQFATSFLSATNAIFQCSGKFNFPKVITLITTIVLVCLIVFMPELNIYKYAFYIFITSIINVAIQIILAIKNGYKFKFKINVKNEDFRKMFKVFLPTVLSSGLYQVSLVTDTIISSGLGEGNVSILGYSNTLMTMINAILLTNLMTYFYPKIAKSIHKDNSQHKMFELMILLSGIMCLVVTGFVVVGKQGIVLLYERGKFTSTITELVFTGTMIYMLGIPINAMRDLVYRYFYAKGDTLTPFKNSLIISCLNIIISIILSKIIGIYGIILGTVITSYMSFSMILFRFNKKFKIEYSKKVLGLEFIKLIIISMIVIIIMKTLIIVMPSMNLIFELFIYGVITVTIYIMMLRGFKSRVLRIKL